MAALINELKIIRGL